MAWLPPVDLNNAKVLLSKTNRIGDVVFALPIAGYCKAQAPSCHVDFLGTTYTRSIVALAEDVDGFVDWTERSALDDEALVAWLRAQRYDVIVHVHPNRRLAQLAHRAGIPFRVGSARRPFHWRTCNRWVWVKRSGSGLHETQLDMALCAALGQGQKTWSLDDVQALRRLDPEQVPPLPDGTWQDDGRFRLILHPMTFGQSQAWPIDAYQAVCERLDPEVFQVCVTGREAEGEAFRQALVQPFPTLVTDTSGRLSLEALVGLIHHADGLVAASTGPVHLAAWFGVRTLGLYAPYVPFDATRWGPVGARTEVVMGRERCTACAAFNGGVCGCMRALQPERVVAVLERWAAEARQLGTLPTR